MHWLLGITTNPLPFLPSLHILLGCILNSSQMYLFIHSFVHSFIFLKSKNNKADWVSHCASNLKVAGNAEIEPKLCKQKRNKKKMRKHRKLSWIDPCLNRAENDCKIDCAGEDYCEVSKKGDYEMAWRIQLWGTAFEMTRQFLSWVLWKQCSLTLHFSPLSE